jgi:glycerol-3-phosphate O-acyltransferase
VLLRSNVSEIIKNGVENVGAFHVKKPILLVENRTFVSQDLSLLFYYHNRLDGYDLHKHI